MRTIRKIIKIRIDDNQLESLKKIAIQMNTSVSELVRYSIDHTLEITNRLIGSGAILKDISKLKTDLKP